MKHSLVLFLLFSARLAAQESPIGQTASLKFASKCIRADELYPGGSLGLDITGKGMTLYVFETAPARTTHIEFQGRVVNYGFEGIVQGTDYSTLVDHCTGVVGVAAAGGIAQGTINARGIAYQANVYTGLLKYVPPYYPIASLPGGAAPILVSNNSTGGPFAGITANDAWSIGSYSDMASVADENMYNNRNWLIVACAGNTDGYTNPRPAVPGYDQIVAGPACSKNSLTVGSVSNVYFNLAGDVTGSTTYGDNCKGPTDDYRIKPEIMALGGDITSTFGKTDTDYETGLRGSSVAAPAVAGACLLLQQFFKVRYGHYMKASTLKALAIHTADEKAFNNGKAAPPDVIRGYGLMNTKNAAQLIARRYVSSIIEESTIGPTTQARTFKAFSNGSPLKVSLCWTDPAAQRRDGSFNNPNDLDLRVSLGNATYLPWTIMPSSPVTAVKADNPRDPYEQVYIDNPGQDEYTVTVTYKGKLHSNLPQEFSIVVSGTSNDDICLASSVLNMPVTDPCTIQAGKITVSSTVAPANPGDVKLIGGKEIKLTDGTYFPSPNGNNITLLIAPCNPATAGTPNVATNTLAYPVTLPRDSSQPTSTGISGNEMSVSPNPTTGEVNILSSVGLSDIRVYSLGGVLALSYTGLGKNHQKIGLGKLAAGIYIIRITRRDGKVMTKRVVKE